MDYSAALQLRSSITQTNIETQRINNCEVILKDIFACIYLIFFRSSVKMSSLRDRSKLKKPAIIYEGWKEGDPHAPMSVRKRESTFKKQNKSNYEKYKELYKVRKAAKVENENLEEAIKREKKHIADLKKIKESKNEESKREIKESQTKLKALKMKKENTTKKQILKVKIGPKKK